MYMRHNLFRKKLKSSLILFVAGVLLVSTLFASAVNIHQAHAASISADKSAKIKLIYGALTTCLRNDSNSEYYQDSAGAVFNPKSEYKISYFNNGGNILRGAYIESIVDTTDNTKTNCGTAIEHDGALSKLLAETGITKEQLYCSYDTSASPENSYGILKNEGNGNCRDVVDQDNIMKLKKPAEIRAYLTDLFTNQVYGGSVPGGSLTEFTSEEKYYMYKTAFTTYCTSGSAHFGDDASSYPLTAYVKNSNGTVELAGYSAVSGRLNNTVETFNYAIIQDNGNVSEHYASNTGGLRTCSEISSQILGNPESEEVVAIMSEKLNSDKTKCNEAYDEQYNIIKDWVSSNGNSLDGNAEADVSTFLSEYNRNGADKWTLVSDGSITCTGLSTMASKWEGIKTRHGLTSAPTVNTEVDYTTSGDTDDSGTGVTATCHTKAGALGWLLCPVLEAVADAANWAYTKVILPRLKTDVNLFQVDSTRNGTYQAWQTFRDIANILFVILLLFVIFSQVSGFGIDNYGIKKTLPKLIVAAVLVNISFYICQGLIDISNIAGSGIYDLLTGISDKITIDGGGFFQGNATSITVGVLEIVAVGAVGTAVAGAAFWSAIGAGIFALVPAILSAAVAILLLFVMLSMRQAVVLVLVALSPLAFVAYALPNTKKLFDRWSSILRGMLLLYPIAALLMAGGRLASRIIFASGDGAASLELTIVAMLAEIVPLFLIPGITRSAYQATGALGAAINRWSARATAGTRNGVRNSQRFQRSSDRIRNFRAQQRTRGNRLLSGGRATARYQAAAAAVAAGTANRRQRMRAFLGRERAAAVNRAAQEAAQREGEKDAWAAANGQAVAEGARNKARIDTGQQIVSVADYANAQFANATIRKVDEEHDNKVQQTLQWNNEQYAAGKHNTNAYAREQDERDTTLWTDAGFIGGQMTQAEIARRAKAADTNLYNDADYVANLESQQNLARREKVRDTALYGDATYVTNLERQSVNARQNKVEDVNMYGNDRFITGLESQQESDRENRLRRTLQWNNQKYRQGKDKANRIARVTDAENTELYTNPDYVSGKLQEAELSREGDVARTDLYTNPNYVASRRNQQGAVISGEIAKMYSDQFSRMGMREVETALEKSVTGASVENRKEQFTAAAQHLIQAGQIDKVRDIISKSSVAPEFEKLIQDSSDSSFRNSTAQIFGSSGNPMFREYSKHLGQEGSSAKSFADWAKSTDSKSLSASIKAKGLNGYDKDDYKYLSGLLKSNPNLLDDVSAEEISRVAAQTNDVATVNELVKVIENVNSSKRGAIITATSPERATNMNQAILDALAGAKLERKDTSGAIVQPAAPPNDTLWRQQLGEAIRDNAQIASRFNQDARTRYIAPPTTSPGFTDGDGI